MSEELARYGSSIPADPELLEPLGRVTLAAIRLHHVVRDALNQLEPGAGDASWEKPLGPALNQLAKKARQRADDRSRDALLSWIKKTGRPAVTRRNKVAHAITFTADGGVQAIEHPDTGRRYTATDLLEVAGAVEMANRDLPRGPYGLQATGG